MCLSKEMLFHAQCENTVYYQSSLLVLASQLKQQSFLGCDNSGSLKGHL